MRVVVVGNEKGGSGKSTTAAHLALGLLLLGKRVATLDIDTRQQTMTRFFCNRDVYATTHGLALPLPDHRLFVPSVNDSLQPCIECIGFCSAFFKYYYFLRGF